MSSWGLTLSKKVVSMSEDLARVAERMEEEEEEEIGSRNTVEWRRGKGLNSGIERRWEGEERREIEEMGTRVEEAIEGKIEKVCGFGDGGLSQWTLHG